MQEGNNQEIERLGIGSCMVGLNWRQFIIDNYKIPSNNVLSY